MVKEVKKSKAKTKISKKSKVKSSVKPEPKKIIKKPMGKQIGVVSNYFDHVKVAAIKLSGGLNVGDKIKIVGGEVDFEQDVGSMQILHEDVKKAKKGDEIGIKIKKKVRKGYKIFKA